MYTWSLNLKNEPKISEAYSMLKHQGLITKDPVCTDLVSKAELKSLLFLNCGEFFENE